MTISISPCPHNKARHEVCLKYNVLATFHGLIEMDRTSMQVTPRISSLAVGEGIIASGSPCDECIVSSWAITTWQRLPATLSPLWCLGPIKKDQTWTPCASTLLPVIYNRCLTRAKKDNFAIIDCSPPVDEILGEIIEQLLKSECETQNVRDKEMTPLALSVQDMRVHLAEESVNLSS